MVNETKASQLPPQARRRRKKLFVTGSSGLIGSEAVSFFDEDGWSVFGVDNNLRRYFFGADGDTRAVLARLKKSARHFEHYDLDIRDRGQIKELLKKIKPDLIIHCAAQPSHDLASRLPFVDFEVNAGGTLNLLEGARLHCPETPFIFMSTNKVYGDAPNELPMVELETRYDYAREVDYAGINESCRIDRCMHSLFGASKVAADVMVQEYGRYFGMPTVCLRGGCLTGSNHAAAELHGFLAYLVRCFRNDRVYSIYGYKGKQVRDNIHSYDVCTLFYAFYKKPKCAAVYNLGGGRQNSVSVLEAISRLEERTGKKLKVKYVDKNRMGDHICYMTDMSRFREDYPEWEITKSLDDIFSDLLGQPQLVARKKS